MQFLPKKTNSTLDDNMSGYLDGLSNNCNSDITTGTASIPGVGGATPAPPPVVIEGHPVEYGNPVPSSATPSTQSGSKFELRATARLFVGGLDDKITRWDLENEFSRFGCRIQEIWMAERPPGFAFVQIENVDLPTVDRIVKTMNGSVIKGSMLRVERARERQKRRAETQDDRPTSKTPSLFQSQVVKQLAPMQFPPVFPSMPILSTKPMVDPITRQALIIGGLNPVALPLPPVTPDLGSAPFLSLRPTFTATPLAPPLIKPQILPSVFPGHPAFGALLRQAYALQPFLRFPPQAKPLGLVRCELPR